MGSTLFRDPQARSSALAPLGTPQPRAFGSLNRVDPLDSASNLYIDKAVDIEIGSDAIVNMLQHYLKHHALGEKKFHPHADNCL